MRLGRRLRLLCLVLVAAALVTTPARRAVASPLDDLFNAILAGTVVAAVVAVSGTTFMVHDASAVSDPPPANRGWATAETAVATPLAVGLNGLNAKMLHDHSYDDGLFAIFLVPTAWMSGLATHGIWSLGAPRSDPGLMLGGSMAIGANAALTVGAIGSATSKRFPGRAYGALEMIFTAPSIAVGAYELASPGHPYKGQFAGLTVWSSLLFLHGIASIEAGVRAEREKIEELQRPIPRGVAGRPRLALTPTALTGGPVPASALVVTGVW